MVRDSDERLVTPLCYLKSILHNWKNSKGRDSDLTMHVFCFEKDVFEAK